MAVVREGCSHHRDRSRDQSEGLASAPSGNEAIRALPPTMFRRCSDLLRCAVLSVTFGEGIADLLGRCLMTS